MNISIEQEMYDAVKKLIEQRYPTGWGEPRQSGSKTEQFIRV